MHFEPAQRSILPQKITKFVGGQVRFKLNNQDCFGSAVSIQLILSVRDV
mgnify:CR=1 FL=1